MRTLVLDLDTRAFASDITPRNRLPGRRDLDFNRPALCHIVFRGDAVIDRYGADLALTVTLNVRIALRLRCPAVASSKLYSIVMSAGAFDTEMLTP